MTAGGSVSGPGVRMKVEGKWREGYSCSQVGPPMALSLCWLVVTYDPPAQPMPFSAKKK